MAFECYQNTRELKQRRFWATHVNRKWGHFPSALNNETVVATTTINSNLHSCICNQKWIFYDTLRLYSARLKTFWIDRFRDIKIHTWLRRLAERNKRNVWFIAEPQDEFFCFIPPSLGAKYDLIYRKWYIDKTYLKTFTSNLRKLSR